MLKTIKSGSFALNTVRIISNIVTFSITLLLITPISNASDKFVSIGTGSITGVYYPAGGSICRLVNKSKADHGIRCTVESSTGSLYNLKALKSGQFDFALVQSDAQYNYYNGIGEFSNEEAGRELRSIFSLYSEAFTVIARSDSNINNFDDIKGKKVNIGNIGSGSRYTFELVMQIKGWNDKDFEALLEYKASDQAEALCSGKVDAIIYGVGHPNGAVQEIVTSCDTVIISVEGADIDKLLKTYPFFVKDKIPGGIYVGSPNDIPTFGMKATFVTTKNTDEETVYQVVRSVLDNFDYFKSLHPVFNNLDVKNMVLDGSTAPLHKGAERYFKEKGLL